MMKKIEIDIRLKEELKEINWLSCLGKKIELKELYPVDQKILPYLLKSGKEISAIPIKQIANLEECIKILTDTHWENVILEWNNILTRYLSGRFQSEYHQWNKIAREGREYFENEILPNIPLDIFSNKDKEKIILNIRSTIMSILFENAYRECKRESFFIHVILPIYKMGHLPCGWEGKLPSYAYKVYVYEETKEFLDGTLIVY